MARVSVLTRLTLACLASGVMADGSDGSAKMPSSGVIVSLTIGIVLAVLLIVAAVFTLCCRKKTQLPPTVEQKQIVPTPPIEIVVDEQNHPSTFCEADLQSMLSVAPRSDDGDTPGSKSKTPSAQGGTADALAK